MALAYIFGASCRLIPHGVERLLTAWSLSANLLKFWRKPLSPMKREKPSAMSEAEGSLGGPTRKIAHAASRRLCQDAGRRRFRLP